MFVYLMTLKTNSCLQMIPFPHIFTPTISLNVYSEGEHDDNGFNLAGQETSNNEYVYPLMKLSSFKLFH